MIKKILSLAVLLAATSCAVAVGPISNGNFVPMGYLDTDITLAADSDTRVPSQKAVKAYVDDNAGGSFSASDITGKSAIDAFAAGDLFAVYDLSATSLKKVSGTQILAWIATQDITFTGTVNFGAWTGIAPAFNPPLTDGATVTVTCSRNKVVQNATVTLGGNRTLAFSGAEDGMTGVLIVIQDGTGSRTLALPAGSLVVDGGGGEVTLSTAPDSIDVLTWIYDGTNYLWTYGTDFN